MITRAEKVKAGIFVVVSIVVMVTIIFLIAGLRLFKGTTTYIVRFEESVTGLEESSVVRYNGVPVGRVSRIGFAKDDFPDIEVTIEVKPGTPIRENTRAMLKPQGITGINYVDLSGGDPMVEGKSIPLLPPRSTIVADPSLAVELMDTLREFSQVVKGLNSVISENRGGISDIVSDIRGASQEARASLAKLDSALEGATKLTTDLRSQLSEAVATAQSSLKAVEDFVKSPQIQAVPGKVGTFLDEATKLASTTEAVVAKADVQAALQRIEKSFERLETIETEVSQAVKELRTGVAENRGAVMRMTDHLQDFALNLKKFSDEIRGDPSRLFFTRPVKEREEER